MLKALGYGRNDIVKILAPFIGNANAQLYPDVDSPIQNAIFFKNPEAINWLAHFWDDYIFQNLDTTSYRGNLIKFAVYFENAEAIKILAPFLKNPHVPNNRGVTPT